MCNKKILVVGGAGFIGSHMLKMLAQAKMSVVCLDDLSTGYRDAVKYGELIVGNLSDINILEQVFSNYQFDGVMHFASFIQVGESVSDPAKYYRNNLINTQNLLDVMVRNKVNNFIFSSTAAVYGNPEYTPIDEKHIKKPINPYGRSKRMIEEILLDYDKAYGLKSVCLRYFNAAGADPEGELSERHDPESHLIPIVLEVALGKREKIKVFGDDYATNDGTCVRDYIHVEDLCTAHLLALKQLWLNQESKQYNLGNGQGFSVLDVIDKAYQVTGINIPIDVCGRRAGDPPVLVANSGKANSELNWQPMYSKLEDMIDHAWNVKR